MPVTATPIFAQAPYIRTASLAAVSACTTRAPTADASMTSTPVFGVALTPVSTNGLRIDSIEVQAVSTAIGAATVAQTVLIWLSDGTTAYVIDEIAVSAVTPSATTPAFTTTKTYATPLAIPATYKLFVSTTVATTASTTALAVTAFGGAY